MAVANYTTDLDDFWVDGATTVSAIGTGGASLGNPETDFFIQGSGSISKGAWTNATKGFIIDGLGATFTVPTDGCVIAFAKYDSQGSLATKAAGGFRMIIGSDDGAYDEFYIGGSDTIAFDSWFPYAIDPNTATADVAGSGGTERWVGVLANLPTSSGPTKGSPIGMDAIRYGRGTIEYTVGALATPATFAGAEAVGNVNSTRWGLLELQNGAYQTQGFHSIGLAGTSVYFDDKDKVLFWRKCDGNATNDAVSVDFNRVEVIHASTTCNWNNIIWSSLGTRAKGRFVHTAGTVSLTDCQFFDWDTFAFIAGTTITGGNFGRCGIVTQGGATITGTGFRRATGTHALTSTPATIGSITGCQFTSNGTGYAVELGTTSDGTTISWENSDTGYAATSGTTGNETIHITFNGTTKDIAVQPGASTPTVHNSGTGTVTVTAGLLTVRITVTDTDNVPIENARVEVRATETVGTITTGDVLLTGLTNASGVIEDTGFVYQAAFNPSGLDISIKARQGSVSPYKVPSTTVGTILDVSGFTTVVALQPDE